MYAQDRSSRAVLLTAGSGESDDIKLLTESWLDNAPPNVEGVATKHIGAVTKLPWSFLANHLRSMKLLAVSADVE